MKLYLQNISSRQNYLLAFLSQRKLLPNNGLEIDYKPEVLYQISFKEKYWVGKKLKPC